MKTHSKKTLAIFHADWEQFPSKPISLLEIMRQFSAYNIYQWDSLLEKWMEETEKPRGTILTKKQVKLYHKLLFKIIENQCVELGWLEAANRMTALYLMLDQEFTTKLPTAESVNRAFFELQMAIHNELSNRKFVMIEEEKADFLEQKKLFGNQVGKAFPSAKNEIQSAGNCLAMDLNTAAVFHLMRVAELGMRALARNLKVKVNKNTIDSAGWTEIIKKIEDSTAERWVKRPKGKKACQDATAFLKCCEVATAELNVFKEIWRNNVMHAGLPYNEHEAHGVFIRVRDFMQRLAAKISETNN
jgi:hypothetical protein